MTNDTLMELIAEFDAHEAERAGKALTNADYAFYERIASLAFDALGQRLTPVQAPVPPPEELDLLDLIPAAVREEVEAVWARWDA